MCSALRVCRLDGRFGLGDRRPARVYDCVDLPTACQPIDRCDELRHGVFGYAGLIAQGARHTLCGLPRKAVTLRPCVFLPGVLLPIAAPHRVQLEIHIHPERLMIGTGSVGVDASRLHPACQRGGHKAEVDAFGVVSGRAFILAAAGCNPGIDESG